MTLPHFRTAAWWILVATSLLTPGFLVVAASEIQNPYLMVPIAAEAIVGALVARRRPTNPIGWVFLGIGASAGLLLAGVGLTGLADGRVGAVPWWGVVAAWVVNWIWYPMLYMLTTLTLLLFPSGLPSRKWRPLLWLSVVSLVGVVAIAALVPSIPFTMDANGTPTSTVPNPLSPWFMANVEDVGSVWITGVFGILSLLCFVAAAVSSVLRSRRASGIERLQMRWFRFAVAAIVAEIILEIALHGRASLEIWLTLAEVVALSFVPIACGIAILRYRLYEIDRIISRTTSYALVTGVLLSVYAIIVTAVTGLLPDSSSNAPAVAAATLAAAALFRPVLARVQAVVDRRFNRSRYDADHAVAEFADRLRDEVEPDLVAADLEATIQRVLQPSATSLWISGAESPPAPRGTP